MSKICLLIHQGEIKKIIKIAPDNYDLYYYVGFPDFFGIDAKIKTWEYQDNIGRDTVVQMLVESTEYYIK